MERYMKKKVLLINPPYPWEENPSPPLGLTSLAGYLLQQGVEVIIEDYVVNPYSRERVRRVLAEFKPDLVGATAVTMNVSKAYQILKDYKEEGPSVKTVIGGPHVTFDAEGTLAGNPSIDFVVRGEGELTLEELAGSLGGDLSGIRGLSYRGGGSIVHNEARPFVEDINIFPYPARHLIQLGKYRGLGTPINMVTSRGCPHQCIFCVGSRMVGRKVRYFDTARVVDEFEMLSKMGFVQINISDDLFTSNKKRCIAICNEIMARGITQSWGAFARVDTVNEELLSILHQAGCRTLCFGMESGNQEILDTIKKKTNLETGRRAVEMCKKAGIQAMTSYILGLPGETPETVEQTMSFAAALSPLYGFHILAPFPGTEVREKCAEYGMRILSSDWDRYDANQSVAESIHVPAAEIDRVVNEFYGGINSYVDTATKQYERKEPLSQRDIDMVESIKSGIFTRDVIFGEMVEKFPGIEPSGADALLEAMVSHVTENSPYEGSFIRKEFTKLVNARCLEPVNGGGSMTYQWS
jgi:anaerobic magnesium-protoporphyrin IX monomethyl ester cyclase